jgi:hypothetical protein
MRCHVLTAVNIQITVFSDVIPSSHDVTSHKTAILISHLLYMELKSLVVKEMVDLHNIKCGLFRPISYMNKIMFTSFVKLFSMWGIFNEM